MSDSLVKENVLLGEFLVNNGLITKNQLNKAIATQKRMGCLLGKTLIDLGFLNEDELIKALRHQLGIQYVSMKSLQIPLEIIHTIPESIARTYKVLPLHKTNESLTLAMANPLDIIAIDIVGRYINLKVKPVICELTEIERAIDYYYQMQPFHAESEPKNDEEFEIDERYLLKNPLYSFDDDKYNQDLRIKNSTVHHLVHLILIQGIKERAVNIQIEPGETTIKIRYKIDGELRTYYNHSKELGEQIISTIKNLAFLDVHRRDIPQSGQFFFRIENKDYYISVSVIPGIFGEIVYLKLQHYEDWKNLKDLGFSPDVLNQLKNLLSEPSGIIWIISPADNGKTTTMYASLLSLPWQNNSIFTYEKSVHIRNDHFKQVQTQSRKDMQLLEAIFQQEPDIIGIDDIDETKLLNFLSYRKLSGRMIIVTLSAHSIISGITKIVHLTSNPYEIISNSRAFIAQFLVQKICPQCKQKYIVTQDEMKIANQWFTIDPEEVFYHGVGCSNCQNKGYWGRTGTFEFMAIDNEIKEILLQKYPNKQLKERLAEKIKNSIIDDIIRKAKAGETSINEAIRIARQLNSFS